MIENKKILLVCTLLSTLAVAVFAGGIQETTDSSSFGIEPPETSTDVNVIGWRYPISEYYGKQMESLSALEDLNVSVQLVDSGGAIENMNMALAAGETSPYEIIYTVPDQIVRYGSNGWLEPLDSYMDKYQDQYDLDDVSDGFYDMGRYNGTLYGIPLATNADIFFYNKEIFDAYDLKPPKYFNELYAIRDALKDASDIELPFAIALSHSSYWAEKFIGAINATGGDWLNEDLTFGLNTPEGIEALELMRDLADLVGEAGQGLSLDDIEIGLETGTIACAILYASRGANMDDPTKSLYVDKIGFEAPFRLEEDGGTFSYAYVDYLSIPAKSDVDKEYLFQIIMEATDLESQIGASEIGIVPRESVLSKVDIRYAEATLESSNYGGKPADHPASNIILTQAQDYVPKIMQDGITAQEILENWEEAYTEEAQRRGYLD